MVGDVPLAEREQMKADFEAEVEEERRRRSTLSFTFVEEGSLGVRLSMTIDENQKYLMTVSIRALVPGGLAAKVVEEDVRIQALHCPIELALPGPYHLEAARGPHQTR